MLSCVMNTALSWSHQFVYSFGVSGGYQTFCDFTHAGYFKRNLLYFRRIFLRVIYICI